MALAGAIALGVGWYTGAVQRWVQAQVVAFYVGRVAPLLPFKIESAEVNAGWRDFFAGRITELALVIRWDGVRVELAGPIEIQSGKGKAFALEYGSRATLELNGVRSSEFNLTLGAKASSTLTDLEEASVLVQAAGFEWKAVGVSGKNLYVGADWRDRALNAEANAEELSWASPGDPNRAVIVTAPQAFVSTPFSEGATGPRFAYFVSAKSSEVLWNEIYLDLPLEPFPLQGFVTPLPRGLAKAEGSAGKTQQLLFSVEPRGAARDELKVRLKTQDPIALAPLLDGVIAATASSGGALTRIASLRSVRVRKGAVSGATSLDVTLAGANSSVRVGEIGGAIHDLDLDVPAAKLAIRGLEASLGRDGKGSIRASRILLRRAETSLGPTPVSMEPKPGGKWKATIGAGSLPFDRSRIPLRVGALEIESGETEPILRTSFELEPMPIGSLTNDLCVGPKQVPPGTLQIQFPRLELTSSWFDPKGSVSAHLFGGRIELSEIAVYDLNTDVPETDFNLSFDGIRLDQAGEWSGFGRMDGVLAGYARGVVFQAWLPTHYDFRFEAKPLNHRAVVFSAQAMENLVKLIASDQLEAMPGIARWFSFGWPSRFFGGYNVDFVGLTLLSKDGTILLETLDPPELFEKERKHYILYGPRFRMPLNSDRYPVVLDAAGMGSFVRNTSKSIQAMIEKQQAEKSGKGPTRGNVYEPEYEKADPKCDPTL